jgi:hypothetical protein
LDEYYLTVLAREFRAGEGSFLLQLRVDLHWDKDAFKRLTEAMRTCCEQYQYTQEQRDLDQQRREQLTEEQLLDEQMLDVWYVHKQDTMLPRWLANGFWYISDFVEEWTSHPAWEKKRAREPDYFKKAYERLHRLAYWFFEGEPPWKDVEQGWASTLIENQGEL